MKILIPLDGSEFAEAVIKPVVQLSSSSSGEIRLIQVVKSGEATVDWTRNLSQEPHAAGDYSVPGLQGGGVTHEVAGVAAETLAQADERVRQSAQDYLSSIAHRYFPGGDIEVVAVTGDDPAKEIIDYARREKVDLIAIATHGRTGLARMMMGSVAGTLLQAQVAPLLIVRPEGLH